MWVGRPNVALILAVNAQIAFFGQVTHNAFAGTLGLFKVGNTRTKR
jgi:hypothetical protein